MTVCEKDPIERLREFPGSRNLNALLAEKAVREVGARRARGRKGGKILRRIAAVAVPYAIALSLIVPGVILNRTDGLKYETVENVRAVAEELGFEIRCLGDDRYYYVEEDDSSFSVSVENRVYRMNDGELAYLYQQADLLRDQNYFYTAKIWIVPENSSYEGFEEFSSLEMKLYADDVEVRYRIETTARLSEVFATFKEGKATYYLRFTTEREEEEMIEVLKEFFKISR